MGAQGYLEERSYFCDRIGEQAFDPKISIADDALDGANLPKAFDFEGTPKQRVDMIENGVIRDVVWDRVTAARAGDGHGHDRSRSSRRVALLRPAADGVLDGRRRRGARLRSWRSWSATASTSPVSTT